jgi:oligopeptide transport system substrate-binding protein
MFASRRSAHLVLALIIVFSVVLGACGAPAQVVPATVAPTTKPAASPTVAAPPPTANLTMATAAATAVATAVATAKPTAAATAGPTAVPTVSEADKKGGIAIYTSAKDAASFDPPAAWASLDWGAVNKILYNPLYRFQTDGKIGPDLASALPSVSADGLVWTIKLKQGVKFSNGREFIADDVKYSMERNAMPDSGTWNATAPMANVVGGQAIIDGKAKTADGIKVVDRYTVQFTLNKVDAYFLSTLTLTTNLIVPKEEVDKWGKDFGFHPVGTGPFILKEWTPKQKIVFVRNPNYFEAGKPYLDGIEMQIGADAAVSLLRFQKGETDMLGDGVPTAQIPTIIADPVLGPNFQRNPSLMMYYLAFNTKTAPFDNIKVRQAIAMALNKDNYVTLSSQLGTKADDWLPKTDYACNATKDKALYPYDVAAAKKLLADAGFANGITVQVWFRNDRPATARLPEAMQQDLAAIGVKVELLQLETAVGGQQQKDGKLAMYTDNWGASFPDPYNFGTEIWQSSSVNAANARYVNADVDKMVVQAQQTVDDTARCKLWVSAADQVLADAAMIPILMLGGPSIRPLRLMDWKNIPGNPGAQWSTMWMPKQFRRP